MSSHDDEEKVIKFFEMSSEKQEEIAKHQVELMRVGGMSDHYDETWIAKQLCDWSADLLDHNISFPPSLAKWLSEGLSLASNGKSLETALMLKKAKGRKYNLDRDVQIKFRAASLAVNERKKMADIIEILAKEENLSIDALRSIIYSKKGWHFPSLKKALKNMNK